MTGMRKLNIANPTDKGLWQHSYVLAFGAYGNTLVLAYADSLDAALDGCVDWIAEHAPGLLSSWTRRLLELPRRATDVWWCIVAEDPSADDLRAIVKGR